MLFTTYAFAVLIAVASARPSVSDPNDALVEKREVPQEHSHEKYVKSMRTLLAKDNPLKIKDPVFALLGDAVAASGKGDVGTPECVQQAVADQAFTNAKADGDKKGMADALVFRALERNAIGVGKATKLCKDKAKNPEIAAISQHQDPASDGAAANNKKVTLELAKQLKAIGADPVQALDAGTFKPGNKSDNSGKGNTCDDQNDPEGCIFTKKLIQPDATEAEIKAA